jgi:hypothetical protein
MNATTFAAIAWGGILIALIVAVIIDSRDPNDGELA